MNQEIVQNEITDLDTVHLHNQYLMEEQTQVLHDIKKRSQILGQRDQSSGNSDMILLMKERGKEVAEKKMKKMHDIAIAEMEKEDQRIKESYEDLIKQQIQKIPIAKGKKLSDIIPDGTDLSQLNIEDLFDTSELEEAERELIKVYTHVLRQAHLHEKAEKADMARKMRIKNQSTGSSQMSFKQSMRDTRTLYPALPSVMDYPDLFKILQKHQGMLLNERGLPFKKVPSYLMSTIDLEQNLDDLNEDELVQYILRLQNAGQSLEKKVESQQQTTVHDERRSITMGSSIGQMRPSTMKKVTS